MARKKTKQENKKGLQLGQHVKFLRSHNKAVELSGTIIKLYDDAPVVDVKLDDHDPDWIETAHIDDVTVLDQQDQGDDVTEKE